MLGQKVVESAIDSEQVDDLMARRKVRPPRDWHDGDFNGHTGGGGAGVKADDADKPKESKDAPIGGPAEGR